jgi:hypothetical protein
LPSETDVSTDAMSNQWRGGAFDGGAESHALGLGVWADNHQGSARSVE